MTRSRAAGLGALVGAAACFAFAPAASAADNGPEVVKNPLPDTCLYLVNTPGYAGHVPGTLRTPPPPGPPDVILICAGPDF
jgi:hypothetical protein